MVGMLLFSIEGPAKKLSAVGDNPVEGVTNRKVWEIEGIKSDVIATLTVDLHQRNPVTVADMVVLKPGYGISA